MVDFRPPRESTRGEFAHTFCAGVRLASGASRACGGRMAFDVQPINGTLARVAARLCNFRTGDAGLLPSHIAWLDSTLAPVVRALPTPWVDIIGYASHLGNEAFNLRLSFDRCEVGSSARPDVQSEGHFSCRMGKGRSCQDPVDPMTTQAFGELSKSSHSATGRLRSRCLQHRPMTARSACISDRRRCPSFLN